MSQNDEVREGGNDGHNEDGHIDDVCAGKDDQDSVLPAVIFMVMVMVISVGSLLLTCFCRSLAARSSAAAWSFCWTLATSSALPGRVDGGPSSGRCWKWPVARRPQPPVFATSSSGH